MIVLDTNVISEMMKPQPDDRVHLWLSEQGASPLTTTAVSVFEIAFGLYCLPDGLRKTQLQTRFEAYMSNLPILPLGDMAAYKAGQFRAIREAAGSPATPSDMMIAGIVSASGGALATRNIKDFTNLPIKLLNPWRD
jgi:predicted nucleic acid-binding protein